MQPSSNPSAPQPGAGSLSQSELAAVEAALGVAPVVVVTRVRDPKNPAAMALGLRWAPLPAEQLLLVMLLAAQNVAAGLGLTLALAGVEQQPAPNALLVPPSARRRP